MQAKLAQHHHPVPIYKVRHSYLQLTSFAVCLSLFVINGFALGMMADEFSRVAIAYLLLSTTSATLLILYLCYLRRKQIQQKAAVIGLVNHHIRNAIQMLYTQDLTPPQSAKLREAAIRVDWTLREVLEEEHLEKEYCRPSKAS